MSGKILRVFQGVSRFLVEDQGQDLVEYALLVALISTAAIAGAGNVATAINNIFTNISNSLA